MMINTIQMTPLLMMLSWLGLNPLLLCSVVFYIWTFAAVIYTNPIV